MVAEDLDVRVGQIHDLTHGGAFRVQEQILVLRLDSFRPRFGPLSIPARQEGNFHAAHDSTKLLAGKGLRQKVQRAETHRFHRKLDGALGGDHDNREVDIIVCELAQDIQPSLASEFHVQENGVKFIFGQRVSPASPEAAGCP